MKKSIVLIIFCLFITTQTAFSAQQSTNSLDKMEESLYGFRYNDESVSKRLDRLEKSVYGTVTKNQPESARITKLYKDLSADSIGKEIEPVEDTFADSYEYIAEAEPEETSDVSYPVVDEMEMQIFNEVNKKDKIKARLAKLEQKTFNKTYSDDLYTRVERLKSKVNIQKKDEVIADAPYKFFDSDDAPVPSDYHLNKFVPPGSYDYEYYNDLNKKRADYYDSMYSTGGAAPFMSQSKKVSLSTIEKKIFHRSYNSDPVEKRLSRIENSMFGSEFASDSNETRIERISSAYAAEKSAGKYDSNRFSQNLATAMQIGTIILMVLACIL